jgi:hypothetical protein
MPGMHGLCMSVSLFVARVLGAAASVTQPDWGIRWINTRATMLLGLIWTVQIATVLYMGGPVFVQLEGSKIPNTVESFLIGIRLELKNAAIQGTCINSSLDLIIEELYHSARPL